MIEDRIASLCKNSPLYCACKELQNTPFILKKIHHNLPGTLKLDNDDLRY